MNRRVFLMILGVILISCGRNLTSDFKMGKLDATAVENMISKSIVVDRDTASGKTDYLNKVNSITTRIIKNNLGQIIAIIQRRNGIIIFGSEYYPNGQEMGDVPHTVDGKITGDATYYYENGKIRCMGRLLDGVGVGEWKYYDEEGTLVRKGMNGVR
jgi:antitoxin component YwqK of YwqJK toxin-antitoxin module